MKRRVLKLGFTLMVLGNGTLYGQGLTSAEKAMEVLRPRVTGGAIFSNGRPRIVPSSDGKTASIESPQFSQAAVYLALETEPRLKAWGSNCNTPSTTTSSNSTTTATPATTSTSTTTTTTSTPGASGVCSRVLDSFVNVRLTTIPVSGAAVEAGIAAPTKEFLQSQKAAQVQFGLAYSKNWQQGDFYFGLGLLGRGMFQSVTDTQRATRVWNLQDDLYHGYTAGLRLTAYGKGDNTLKSPVAYFDFSWGQFQNFEKATGKTTAANNCLKDPAACLALGSQIPPKSDYAVRVPHRMYSEARIFWNNMYLGFDLNNGDGPDDLRFIFGVTVALNQFLK